MSHTKKHAHKHHKAGQKQVESLVQKVKGLESQFNQVENDNMDGDFNDDSLLQSKEKVDNRRSADDFDAIGPNGSISI